MLKDYDVSVCLARSSIGKLAACHRIYRCFFSFFDTRNSRVPCGLQVSSQRFDEEDPIEVLLEPEYSNRLLTDQLIERHKGSETKSFRLTQCLASFLFNIYHDHDLLEQKNVTTQPE